MKFSVLLIASVLILATISCAYKPTPVCFRKTEKCCYGFHGCGVVVRKLRISKRCDFKKCHKVCTRHCYRHCERRHVRVPKRICKPRYVHVCKKVEVERYGKWIWETKCRYARRGQRCHTKFHYIWKKVCTRKCYPKCYRRCYFIHAVCTYHRIFHYHKFCPKLYCYPPYYTGPYKVPAHVVSPKGKLVKTTGPVRTVIGKRRH